MDDDLYGDLDAGVASAEVARLRADLSRAEASAATADGELSRARARKFCPAKKWPPKDTTDSI